MGSPGMATLPRRMVVPATDCSLLIDIAISRSPLRSARMPCALLPLTSQTFVHFCPAAMTPGIAATV